MDLFREHVFPKLNEAHRKDLRPVTEEFRTVFCLFRDEDQALWCLQCLRNILAHGALSLYQVSEENDGPMLAYFPAPKGKNNPCRHCSGYPYTDAQGGVTVGFGSGQVRTYFGNLRTVGEALDRIAFRLGLEHAELLCRSGQPGRIEMPPDPNALSVCDVCSALPHAFGIQVLPCWLDCVLMFSVVAALVLLVPGHYSRRYRVNSRRLRHRSRLTMRKMQEDVSWRTGLLNWFVTVCDCDQQSCSALL